MTSILIKAVCNVGGMQNFCACTEDGKCYKPVEEDNLTHVELVPSCDPKEGIILTDCELGSLRLTSPFNLHFLTHLMTNSPTAKIFIVS